MAHQQWRREEEAIIAAQERALCRWRIQTERVTPCQVFVCERTLVWLIDEAERMTVARNSDGRPGAVMPGQVIDDIVRRLQKQGTLPFVSKRRYDNRRRRGW